MTDAALAFLNWTEPEARERLARLLATGWSASQVAEMFGLSVAEIERLAGHSDPRTVREVSA
jgi:hypothetical protein